MSGRIIAAACALAVLGACAGSPDETPGPSPDALASRGYDAYNQGDYGGAVSYFEESLAADPKNGFALRGLAASRDGVLHFGGRRPVGRETRRAIRRVSRQGYDSYDRGDLAAAAARFRAILALVPDDARALEGLEAVRLKAGERRVVEAIASTVAIDPSPAAARDGEYLPVGSYEAYERADGMTGEPSPDRSPEEAIAGWTIPPERYR